MTLNLAQLEAYYWIARLGSFHAAATRLNLTQPTISARIKELERGLGVSLFERSGRRIRLTARGAAMLEYVERVLLLLDDLPGQLRGHDPLRGLLRLGAPDSFALMCLAELLKVLEQHYPELQVAVTVDNSRALGRMLEDGVLDVAYIVHPQLPSRFLAEPLGWQDLAWVASPGVEVPGRVLQPKDLVHHQIFTNPAPANLFVIVKAWFEKADLTPPRLSTCNSLAVIAALVSAGAGMSVLPTCILDEHFATGLLRPLSVRPRLPRQQVFAAYPASSASRGIPEILHATRDVLSRTGLLTP